MIFTVTCKNVLITFWNLLKTIIFNSIFLISSVFFFPLNSFYYRGFSRPYAACCFQKIHFLVEKENPHQCSFWQATKLSVTPRNKTNSRLLLIMMWHWIRRKHGCPQNPRRPIYQSVKLGLNKTASNSHHFLFPILPSLPSLDLNKREYDTATSITHCPIVLRAYDSTKIRTDTESKFVTCSDINC